MPGLARIRAVWAGVPGLPGINTWYVPGGVGTYTIPEYRAFLKTFYASIQFAIPTSVSVTIETSGDILEGAGGTLVNTWSDATPQTLTGQGVANLVGGLGVFMRARTDTVFGGRRVKGGVFLAPCFSGSQDPDGSVKNSDLAAGQAGAAALLAHPGAEFYVSAAARPAVAGPPARPASAYHQGLITSLTLVDRFTQLKSRRA